MTRRISRGVTAKALRRGFATTSAADPTSSYVVVFDNRVVTREVVDFLLYPDGIDGRTGSRFQVDLI